MSNINPEMIIINDSGICYSAGLLMTSVSNNKYISQHYETDDIDFDVSDTSDDEFDIE
jgi:hypothetical protein